MQKYIRLFVLAMLLALVSSQQFPSDCHGSVNNNPIAAGTPVFVNQTKNGKRYFVKVPNSNTPIHVVQLYGSSYEMGYAYGSLFKQELKDQITTYFGYLEKQIEEVLKRIPEFFSKYIAEFGLKAALDLNYEITKKYTPQRYDEEMKGISDASGIPVADIRRLNLLPELIKAACSIYGAWGKSTPLGSLYQLRALDWDSKATIAHYPTVVVYHPTESNSSAFANIGYLGLIGTITGFSSTNIGISEKVWITEREKDITTRFGTPWMYVLRDVLQFSTDMDSALTRIVNAHRTCAIHVGLGDSVTGEARALEYSYKELNIYDWMTQFNTKAHPQLNGVVYWDKHVQPSGNNCLGGLLQKFYGNITPENTIKYILPLHQTGDTQSVVMDFANETIYIAYAATDKDPTPYMKAYDRTFVSIPMRPLFDEKL